MTLIRLTDVSKAYPATSKDSEPVVAVDNVTLAIGAVVDLRNAETGHKVSHDSPYAGQELKLVAKRQKRISRR